MKTGMHKVTSLDSSAHGATSADRCGAERFILKLNPCLRYLGITTPSNLVLRCYFVLRHHCCLPSREAIGDTVATKFAFHRFPASGGSCAIQVHKSFLFFSVGPPTVVVNKRAAGRKVKPISYRPNKMQLFAKLLLLFSTILLSMLSNIIGASNIDHALQHRQNIPVGTGASASNVSPSNSPSAATSAASPNSPTSSPDNSPESPSSAAAEQTTSDEANNGPSPSATIPPQSATQEVNQGSTTTMQDPTSSGPRSTTNSPSAEGNGDNSTADQTLSGSVSSQTQPSVTTVVTVSGSSTRTSISTGSTVVPVSTFSVTSTRNATTLDEPDSGSSKSGLGSSQKRIVIGVVVGIGGAILLGGIAVVAWRIWGRKGRATDDDNDLMDSHPGSSGREKHSSVSGQSPFRSTLDQYHNQTGPVNTASNF